MTYNNAISGIAIVLCTAFCGCRTSYNEEVAARNDVMFGSGNFAMQRATKMAGSTVNRKLGAFELARLKMLRGDFRGSSSVFAPQLEEMFADDRLPVYVAVDEEERVLGYAFCAIREPAASNVLVPFRSVYLDDLCVDENTRGKGIGKAIYREICRFAAQRRCYSVTLNVWCCNESAMKFYESLGLKPQKIGMENVLC